MLEEALLESAESNGCGRAGGRSTLPELTDKISS